MTTLIERLRAASGPSRELDMEIAMEVGWTTRPGFPYPWLSPDACAELACPAYTASLDAAMTLVPDDCLWALSELSDGQFGADCDTFISGLDYPDHRATTPAIALCIACLLARGIGEKQG